MMAYPSFIYLQNQKTGCTFVETFLRKFCSEPLLAHAKHAALHRSPGKFCFTNVREPLALYRSLFTYGLDGKGSVFLRLRRLGHGGLYDKGAEGFSEWLDFVLSPRHAQLLSNDYRPEIARLVGFMSWRFLRLACPGIGQKALVIKEQYELEPFVENRQILGSVLRQEKLREDLEALASTRLASCIPQQVEALQWLRNSPLINTSSADTSGVSIQRALLNRVFEREWYLYRHFYPDAMTSTLSDIIDEKGIGELS